MFFHLKLTNKPQQQVINVKDKGGIFVSIVVIKHGRINYGYGFM